MFVFLDVKAKRIRTKDVYIVGSGMIVAELLEPDCRIRFALRPQEGNAFAANRNPGMSYLRSFSMLTVSGC